MKETAFKKALMDSLRENGFAVYRIENKVEPGIPDLLVIRKKDLKAFFIEVKIDKEPLGRLQELWITKHLKEGGRVVEARLIQGKVIILRRAAVGPSRVPRWDEGYTTLWPSPSNDEAGLLGWIAQIFWN